MCGYLVVDERGVTTTDKRTTLGLFSGTAGKRARCGRQRRCCRDWCCWGRRPGSVGHATGLRTLLITTIGTGVIIILWLLRLLQTGNTARWNRPRRPRQPPIHGQATTMRTVPKIRNNPRQISSHPWAQTPPPRSPNQPRMDNRRSSSHLWRNQHHGHPHQTRLHFIPASIPFSNRTPPSLSLSSSPTSIQTPRWPLHTST